MENDFFKETFFLLNNNQEKYLYRLKHGSFSQEEKRVLKAFLYFKREKKDKVFQELRAKRFSTPFLEASRYYLLGMTHNHFGEYEFAREKLEEALTIFKAIDERDLLFFCSNILALVFANQKRFDLMKNIIEDMAKMKNRDDYRKLVCIRLDVIYFSNTSSENKALKILNDKRIIKLKKYELFSAGLLLSHFNLLLTQKKYDQCYEILAKYSKSKGFTVKMNYKYMKLLLDHICKEKPLYVYKRDFKDFPELYWQLEVIKNLSKGNIPQASSFWMNLANHNAQLYRINFNYTGESGLFSLGLKMYDEYLDVCELNKAEIQSLKKPMEKLEYILGKITRPIEKSQMIDLIWNEETSELNLARLRKLVWEYKKKHGVSVKSIQETYFIEKSA